ncbi:hypothetical protein BVC71_03655 [Marivivens niveibacter]|uniref:Outer membrane protein beta-barrel domain-containing protein n=1 Tax=Marivivens niveibacter TaxID=1930667 RepID=A0A251X2J0_9RHOB|nr:hypothetical protein [Marivivens niveibacter]OUD10598.1 hypothetical protein BVC71_03655 [Marivivens niveibacter]
MMTTKRRFALLLSTAAIIGSAGVAQDGAGFAIVVGGAPVSGDRALANTLPDRQIPQLQQGRIDVIADGLATPRVLDMSIRVDQGRATIQTLSNYPAFISASELRIYDGGKLVSVHPAPIGQNVTIATQENQRIALRVYGQNGRYDETVAIPVDTDRSFDTSLSLAHRSIAVTGGAVTVSATDLPAGASLNAFGDQYTAGPNGRAVIQRILPVGSHVITASANGAASVSPVITIPNGEWETTGRAELTYGKSLSSGDTWNRGQIAFYTRGRTANGWSFVGAADTGERPVDQLFNGFAQSDPLNLLARLNPDLAYATYGDDSTATNDAPTDGRFYLRAERDGSYVMWGNARAPLTSTELMRNERAIYGASGRYEMPSRTTNGDPRLTVSAYAATPDSLSNRDILRGTGGSVYFLNEQFIAPGSEIASIVVADPDTGRVISRRYLTAGTDYDINYTQGLITLAAPLSAAVVDDGALVAAASDQNTQSLVVQYDYAPTGDDIDGYAYGTRVEGWANDRLQIGATATVDRTGSADQTAQGVDIAYHFGESSVITAEAAMTRGPGYGAEFSADGGSIYETTTPTAGNGRAFKLNAEMALSDLGADADGQLRLWSERYSAGFSTPDRQFQTDQTTTGFDVTVNVSDRLAWGIAAERIQSGQSKETEVIGELSYAVSDRWELDFGISHTDKTDTSNPTENGRRTDAAVKATYAPNDDLSAYAFGQSTLHQSGALSRNDRIGIGASYAFTDTLSAAAEVSTGTDGTGGLLRLDYDNGTTTTYFGYELAAGRTISGVDLVGRDKGRFITGGSSQLTSDLNVFSENSYDMFGRHQSIGSTFGAEYRLTNSETISASFETGRIIDPAGDFDRNAISFAYDATYETKNAFSALLEYRRDNGTLSATEVDRETIAVVMDGIVRINDDKRVLLSFDGIRTIGDDATLPAGDYVRAKLGYAYRPTTNDRLNVLASYTYLADDYGQSTDGTDDAAPLQRSHVASINTIYDLTDRWTISGKIGARISQSATDAASAYTDNDAWIAIANARYHLPHEWDALVELRYLNAVDADFAQGGALIALSRKVTDSVSLGIGYNATDFSDDLTDLTRNDQGAFITLMAEF